MNKSLSKIIFKSLETNSDLNVIGKKINKEWKWTNKSDIRNLVINCKNMLDDYSIKKGDRVAYKGRNSIEWLCWNLAVNSKGAIWVPMYSDQNLDYCKHITEDCKPKIMITESDVYNYNSELRVPCIDNLIPNLNTNDDMNFDYHEISSLIYTSGTTGKPKGVMLSNESIIANIIINEFKIAF